MFNRYIINLYKQYCDACGLTFEPLMGEKLSKDFLNWLISNKDLVNKYVEYLISLGYFDFDSAVEVGKGKYDCISSFDIALISPYAETLKLPNSELLVLDGVPLVVTETKTVLPQQQVLLTHNPYVEMGIRNWSSIHNLGNYDISIGMFGSIYDQDFKNKIKLIDEISKQMLDHYTIDYDTYKDKYFCSLNSIRKVKIKTKNLTK